MIHLAVMGNPIAHSRSPLLHQYFAKSAGIDVHYEKQLVALGEIESSITAFFQNGGKGCNITLPFKQDVYTFLNPKLTDRALLSGSVNTVFIQDNALYGDNTDGVGLVNDIKRQLGKTGLSGQRILIIGAGGATRGVIPSLLDEGITHLHIANRTVSKAASLIDYFSQHLEKWASKPTLSFSAINDAPPCDIIINASSSSLSQEALPLNPEVLQKASFAYDMLYTREGRTAFLDQCSCPKSDGLGMLIYQGLEAFSIWTGLHPSIHYAELEQLLRMDG
ncbi:shikimate dehydrogenase [Basilea psittacipulmonis]|uniref:Shikimate dehydrogenase (NADP(+)) n=1 Tax=Basilea psittacipulmonis DSM 24701 TaxID=1072685 RepID=A0A077DBT9_9BURK|nr:shikimate dehydrogenase [Basilea psittacipulmonis]AIL32295.1 hypothetical protein IX83_02260 [Basilea psittacipulmonis DSM 24701]